MILDTHVYEKMSYYSFFFVGSESSASIFIHLNTITLIEEFPVRNVSGLVTAVGFYRNPKLDFEVKISPHVNSGHTYSSLCDLRVGFGIV